MVNGASLAAARPPVLVRVMDRWLRAHAPAIQDALRVPRAQVGIFTFGEARVRGLAELRCVAASAAEEPSGPARLELALAAPRLMSDGWARIDAQGGLALDAGLALVHPTVAVTMELGDAAAVVVNLLLECEAVEAAPGGAALPPWARTALREAVEAVVNHAPVQGRLVAEINRYLAFAVRGAERPLR